MVESDCALPIASATGITKRYGQSIAVDGLSVEIARGKITGLLGPNGAGKSTTMVILSGLKHADAGEVRINGKNIGTLTHHDRRIFGIVPQDNNLDQELTVIQNLEVFGTYFGFNTRVARKQARTLLEEIGFLSREHDRVDTLSGGMQRRLIIARAQMSSPELLIIDEPSSGLDAQSRKKVWQELIRLKNSGVSIIVSTHYMEEAEQLCDYIYLIKDGKVLEQGAPIDVVNQTTGKSALVVEKPVSAMLYDPAIRRYDNGKAMIFFTDDASSIVKRLPKGAKFSYRNTTLEDVMMSLGDTDSHRAIAS